MMFWPPLAFCQISFSHVDFSQFFHPLLSLIFLPCSQKIKSIGATKDMSRPPCYHHHPLPRTDSRGPTKTHPSILESPYTTLDPMKMYVR
jgi:hypothetical protein